MLKKFLLTALAGCLLVACEGQQGSDTSVAPATTDQAGGQEQAQGGDGGMAAPAIGPPEPNTCFSAPACPADRQIAFDVDQEWCAANGGKSFLAGDGCTDL